MTRGPTLRSDRPWQPVTAQHVRRERLPNLRPMSPLYVGVVKVVSEWLELPLSPGWTVAFRLITRGVGRARRTRIAELHIYPFEQGAEAGDWSGVRAGRRARLPRTNFSFTRLRQIVTERVFLAALAAERAKLIAQGGALLLRQFNAPVASRGPRDRSPNRGRPGLPLRHYAALAKRYDDLEHEERVGGESTRRRLAQELGVKETTIAKRLQRARDLKYLDKPKVGQRGSHVTQLALRALSDIAPEE